MTMVTLSTDKVQADSQPPQHHGDGDGGTDVVQVSPVGHPPGRHTQQPRPHSPGGDADQVRPPGVPYKLHHVHVVQHQVGADSRPDDEPAEDRQCGA